MVRATTETRAYLRLLERCGPLTDHEAHAALHLPLWRVDHLRYNALVVGLVERTEIWRVWPSDGAISRAWRVSMAGRAAAVKANAAQRVED